MSTLNTTIKLSHYQLDSAKKPELYAKWESDFMSAVDSDKRGPPLNEFLRNHWGIDKTEVHSIPDWQFDDKFDFGSDYVILSETQEEVISATKPQTRSQSGRNETSPEIDRRERRDESIVLDSISKIAVHFPKSMDLDRELYPLLKSCISGPLAEIIKHVKQRTRGNPQFGVQNRERKAA